MAVDYRKIPTRKEIEGDYSVGVKYIGQAMTMLHNLERNMQFQKLKQLSDHWTDGKVIIEAWHGFGLSSVRIVTKGGPAPKPLKPTRKECFCLPCFSMGFITAVTFDDPCSYYDVEICQKTKKTPDQIGVYVEVTDVLSLDYAVYEVGQPVLVSIIPCSSGPSCGCSTGVSMCEITAVGALPCSPMIVPLHLETAGGEFQPIPRWKQVEYRWGALY